MSMPSSLETFMAAVLAIYRTRFIAESVPKRSLSGVIHPVKAVSLPLRPLEGFLSTVTRRAAEGPSLPSDPD